MYTGLYACLYASVCAGIFVDGALQCIGEPKELVKRYGDHFVLSVTTLRSSDTRGQELTRQFVHTELAGILGVEPPPGDGF